MYYFSVRPRYFLGPALRLGQARGTRVVASISNEHKKIVQMNQKIE